MFSSFRLRTNLTYLVVLGHAIFLNGRTFDLDENAVNSANDALEYAHIPTLSQREFICEFA